jgi:hypothetical protein
MSPWHLKETKEPEMAVLVQVAVCGALLAYLWQCRAYMHRRNRATWESLVSQLHFFSATDDHLPSTKAEALLEAAAENGQTSCDPRSLWMHFNHARVVLETADFAERNGVPGLNFIDPALLASVRRDAMQIRISALAGLAKCALPK